MKNLKDYRQKEVIRANDILAKYKGIAQDNYEKQKEWTQFVYGDQYKTDVKEALESIGHAPIAFNYIISAVQQGIAFLSANNPSFSVTGRDDSDTKIGKMFADFLRYLWYISDGGLQQKQLLKSYFIKGVGHQHVYEDLNDDYGRGELKFKTENNWDVYVDPSSKNQLYDDAKDIFISRMLTGETFANHFPDFIDHLKEATPVNTTNIPSSEIMSDNVQFEDDISDYDTEKYELVYRYILFREPYYHFTDNIRTHEEIMSVEEWEEEWANKPIFFIKMDNNIQLFDDPMQFQQTVEQLKSQNVMFEYDVSTYEEFVQSEEEYFSLFSYKEKRVKQFVYIGDVFMFEKVLPIPYYPVIPTFNIYNDTPYPISDVTISVPIQEFINKMMSLVVAHTQATTTLKLIVPKGSVDDLAQLEADWMRPYAAIEVDTSFGEPKIAQTQPLNGTILSLIQMAKHLIEYQFGIFESQMGNGDSAPTTFKGTLAIDEFGQRRIKSKLQDIDVSLSRLGQVLLMWSQKFYTDKKVFRLIQPDNSKVEGEINGMQYDDFGGVIGRFNDITSGRYDVVTLAGSTLPVNRFAEWETYKEAYQMGLIDQEEALKKSEIFDKEGVMERMSTINKLSAQVEQATTEIKKLQGDLQTADRIAVGSKKAVEVEKFKTSLNNIIANLKKDESIQEKTLEYEVNKVLDSMQGAVDKIETQKECENKEMKNKEQKKG